MIHKMYKYNNLRQQQQSQRSLMPQSPAPHCSRCVGRALLICLGQSEMFACCTEHMLEVLSTGAGRLLPLCHHRDAAAANLLPKCRAQTNTAFSVLLGVFLMLGLSEHCTLKWGSFLDSPKNAQGYREPRKVWGCFHYFGLEFQECILAAV